MVAGDGTTSVTVLCGALLRKSLELLEKGVHPTVISDAFGRAAERAVEVRCAATLGLGGLAAAEPGRRGERRCWAVAMAGARHALSCAGNCAG